VILADIGLSQSHHDRARHQCGEDRGRLLLDPVAAGRHGPGRGLRQQRGNPRPPAEVLRPSGRTRPAAGRRMLKRLGLAAGEPRRQTVWALIGDLDTEPDSHSLPSVRMWRAGPHTPGPERAVVIAGPPNPAAATGKRSASGPGPSTPNGQGHPMPITTPTPMTYSGPGRWQTCSASAHPQSPDEPARESRHHSVRPAATDATARPTSADYSPMRRRPARPSKSWPRTPPDCTTRAGASTKSRRNSTTATAPCAACSANTSRCETAEPRVKRTEAS
jgi:hypothetical protein